MVLEQQFVAFRQTVYPPVDTLSRRTVDKYVAYPLHALEYIGKSSKSVDALWSDLQELGYSIGYLSALKYHWDGDVPDCGSYRRIDPANERWQWHVHLFENGDGVELASHYEFRPDLRRVASETHNERMERLREHYRPKWSTRYDEDEATYFLGETCPVVTDYLLDSPSAETPE